MATAKLTAVVTTKGVKKSEAELNKFTKSANDAESQTKKMGKGVAGLKAPFLYAVSFVGKAAAAATAFAVAGAAVVVSSSKANREIEILARQARTSASDFQAAAFATEQYGITAEQFADISKDVADKVGEFATAGTGAFQDYADVLGLTKEEAIKTAKEFQGLSSQEVIGKMTDGLESVNATGDQTTFVLESIGNDLSRLAPLFANNSSELNTLKDRYKDVNSQLALTSEQSKALDEVAASGTLLTSSLGNASKLISSAVAPILDDFFNSVISVVPAATQTIVDFINKFKEIDDISSLESIDQQTNTAIGNVNNLRDTFLQVEDNIKRLQQQGIVGESIINQERARLAQIQSEIDAQNSQIDKLQQRKKEIQESNSISAPSRPSGGSIGGSSGGIFTGDKKENLAAEIEKIISLNDTALQKIDAAESERKAKVKQALSQGLIDKVAALDAEIAAEVNAESQRLEIRKREEDQKIRNQEAAQQQLEQFIQLNNTELEEVDRVESERLTKIEEYRDKNLIALEDFEAAKTEIESSAQKDREDILDGLRKKREKKEEDQRASLRSVGEGVLSDLATIGGKQGKFLKAQAKVNAVVKTYESANSAYAALAPIPIVGPVLGAAAAGVAIAAGLANVRAIDSAREQGGMLGAGQTSTVAERGLEILTPANASRVRTANDMKNIMGEGNSAPTVNMVIIDQSEGGKEFDQSTDDEGRIVLLIRNTVSGDLSQSNSQISKSLGGNTTAQRRRA
jgi:hypothetical protein